MSSSAIGSVLESMLRSVHESRLRAGLGVYSQAGWLCTIERSGSVLGSMPESVSENGLEGVLGSVLAVHLEVS